MTKYFFITGMPRSRTAWYANLFMTENVHCYHDIASITSFERVIEILRCKQQKQYVGICDPNPSAVERLTEIFRDAPLVILKRNRECSERSFLAAFPFVPYEAAYNFTKSAEEAINRVSQRENVLIVEFSEFGEHIVETVWKFCLPELPVDLPRIRQLLTWKITSNNDLNEQTFERISLFWRNL